MRLIKKQEQSEAQVRKLTFTGGPEEIPPAPSVPAWMETAASRTRSATAAFDPARAEKAAYDEGFHQGQKAGIELAEARLEAMMKRYAETIGELGKVRPRLHAQVEQEVVRLALEVAKKVVHREVQVDREIVQTLIRVALSHVAVRSAVNVRLNPTDYKFVLEQRRASGQHDGDREVVLLADNSIARGGCLIETECGDIDARIEEEFREVERAFFSCKD